MVKKDFTNVAARLSWELFKRTGRINYYFLYRNLEDEKYLSDVMETENNYEGPEMGR